ncbi:hypothetical protein Tco_1276342 [Tanacetum coccineum]
MQHHHITPLPPPPQPPSPLSSPLQPTPPAGAPPSSADASQPHTTTTSSPYFPKKMESQSETTQTVSALKLPEVIVNGDSVIPVASASAGAEVPIPPKTPQQKLARKNELKAKSILLLSHSRCVPNEVFAAGCKVPMRSYQE